MPEGKSHDMTAFQRIIAFFASLGAGLCGYQAAPLLWNDDPFRGVMVLGCVFIVGMGWLLEALTGEKHV